MVQILVGIVLGPSLLGRLAPELVAPLISPQALAPLSGIATLAVILFAFVIGLHADVGLLRGRGPALVWIGIGSAFLPTLLGAGAGLLLAHQYPETVGPQASAGEFAAAVGICAGVTALPVLGAILLQMGLLRQRLGQLALACAAINDALLWIFLAGLLAYGAGWQAGGGTFWPVLVGGPLYLLLLFGLVRPALARLATSCTEGGGPGQPRTRGRLRDGVGLGGGHRGARPAPCPGRIPRRRSDARGGETRDLGAARGPGCGGADALLLRLDRPPDHYRPGL